MKQQDLLKSKGILTLEFQDLATSDDPLEACLERAGYNLKKQAELRASISEKLTLDMFSASGDLSAEERAYQEAVDRCIKRLKGAC